MKDTETKMQDMLKQEIEKIPSEHLPALLTIVYSFRKSVALGSAEGSFEQGWKEVSSGDYQPLDDLWKGLDH
ncbi:MULTISPECIES: hypothetical protein [unclassified Endozoicomonas]|uniref:hypothetical protein n=1 Tax=unclassified Endozoicomonas TaxID=2644528 RepID=UPI003BB773A8